MATTRKSGLPSFGLPYPMASSIGRQKAMELIGGYAGALAKLYGRAMQYGMEENNHHVNTLIDLYGRIMNPAEQIINGYKGQLGVLHAGALGYGQRGLMDAQETLQGLQSRFPGPAQPPMVNGHRYQITKPPIPGERLAKIIPPGPYPGPYPIPPISPLPPCPPVPPCPIPEPCPPCPNCVIDISWVINVVISVIQQLFVTLNVSLSQSQSQWQSLVNVITQQVIVDFPQPKIVGADCDHALHVHICNAPVSADTAWYNAISDGVSRVLGGRCQDSLNFALCVPVPPEPAPPCPS